MDQIFETFMGELREEKGPEEDTVTSLCKKDHPQTVSEVRLLSVFRVCLLYMSTYLAHSSRQQQQYIYRRIHS